MKANLEQLEKMKEDLFRQQCDLDIHKAMVNHFIKEKQAEQLTLTDVVVELPSKNSKEFERWAQSKGYEPAFNGLWYEKNNQTYNTDLLHRAFTNEIEFGN